MDNGRSLDISWSTILKLGLALLGFYVIYLVRDVLILIIFSLIISLLLNPAIDFLQKRKVPRSLAAVFVYLAIFGVFGLLLFLIIPPFVSETQTFVQFLPQYFDKLAPSLRELGFQAFENFESFVSGFGDLLLRSSGNIFSALAVVFGGIISTFTIFTIATFISLEEKGVERIIGLVSPKKYEAYILDLWLKTQTKVSKWFGTRILSSFFVGLLVFISAEILGAQYSVSFGIISGLFNIVPIIGPIVSGGLIFLFTFVDSWMSALILLAAFILIQQIENNIVSPLLTKKIIGLPPVLVLISLMLGGKLLGFLGALLAIPLAGVIYEFLRDFLKKKKEEKTTVL